MIRARRRKGGKKKVQKEKENLNTKIGTVVESLPNTLFRVDYSEDNKEDGSNSLTDEDEFPIVGLNGKMKRFRIKVLIGDKVEVLQDEYGGRGRIIKRLKN